MAQREGLFLQRLCQVFLASLRFLQRMATSGLLGLWIFKTRADWGAKAEWPVFGSFEHFKQSFAHPPVGYAGNIIQC